jgi:hypothetical protein
MAVRDLMSQCSGQDSMISQQCANLLTVVIVNHNGLKEVLQGYLDGTFASSDASAIQARICKAVTSCPAKMEKSAYFQSFCPQVLSLIYYGFDQNDRVLLNICVNICIRLCIASPQLCQSIIIRPILNPLLMIDSPLDAWVGGSMPLGTVVADDILLVTEDELTRSLMLTLQLLTATPPESKLVSLFINCGALRSFFKLHSFLCSNALTCMLRVPCATVCNVLLTRNLGNPRIINEVINCMVHDTINYFCCGPSAGIEIRASTSNNRSRGSTETVALTSFSTKSFPRFKCCDFDDVTRSSYDQLAEIFSGLQLLNHVDLSDNDYEPEKSVDFLNFESKLNFISASLTCAYSLHLIFESDTLLSGFDNGCGKSQAESQGSLYLSALFGNVLHGYLINSYKFGLQQSSSSVNLTGDINSCNLSTESYGIILLCLQSCIPMSVMLANGN